MDERVKFVARLLDGETMSGLCREFGISRKTGYKLYARYRDCGVEGLSDRSRRPYRHANQLPTVLVPNNDIARRCRNATHGNGDADLARSVLDGGIRRDAACKRGNPHLVEVADVARHAIHHDRYRALVARRTEVLFAYDGSLRRAASGDHQHIAAFDKIKRHGRSISLSR